MNTTSLRHRDARGPNDSSDSSTTHVPGSGQPSSAHLFAEFKAPQDPPHHNAAAAGTKNVDFRVKHSVRHYPGTIDTGTPHGLLYTLELQALDELRTGEGKYAALPIIYNIMRHWQTDGPSPEARAAYGLWIESGSLELLLDALVAEMQRDGTWVRLAGDVIAADNIQILLSDALAGAPYDRDKRINRQACQALADWSALDNVMENRAVEKKLRFVKVMKAAFREMEAGLFSHPTQAQPIGPWVGPHLCR